MQTMLIFTCTKPRFHNEVHSHSEIEFQSVVFFGRRGGGGGGGEHNATTRTCPDIYCFRFLFPYAQIYLLKLLFLRLLLASLTIDFCRVKNA